MNQSDELPLMGDHSMQILLVTWNYPPKIGGMETLLSQMVRTLRCHAHVRVIGPNGDRQALTGCEKDVIRPRRTGVLWYAIYASLMGCRLLKGNDYDAILAGSALVAPIAYALGRLYDLPTITNVYGLDIVHPNPLYQWLMRLILPRCNHVFAISQIAKEKAVSLGVSPSRASVIHPGLDFSEFEAAPDPRAVRARYRLGDRPYLLSVGRLARRKGIPEFIRYSLPDIVKEYPEILFLIIGDNPTLSLTHKEDIKTRIQAEVQSTGLENNVRLLGWVDRTDLLVLYHSCEVFVLPGINVPHDIEGFGIVLIEAGAAGKPVASTRVGGIPDAVLDGQTGILVDPEAWDDLSRAILSLLGDQSLRDQMGCYGRERAKSEFDWSAIGKQQLEILRRLADGERPSESS